jgi:hypothetical protein
MEALCGEKTYKWATFQNETFLMKMMIVTKMNYKRESLFSVLAAMSS